MGEISQRTFPEPLESDPFRIVPVNGLRDGFSEEFFAAFALAYFGPVGHINKNSGDVVCQNLCQLLLKNSRASGLLGQVN